MAPVLSQIKTGWAAHGNGWAVHGSTQDEALQRFHEAEAKHREIDARRWPWEQPSLPTGEGIKES